MRAHATIAVIARPVPLRGIGALRGIGVLAVIGAVACLTAGCDLLTGIEEERVVGAIGYPDHLAITIPDTVQAGQGFTVTVRTLGGDGCWSHDRTEVRVDGLRAVVTPYDVRRRERGTMCTLATVEIMHTAGLVFAGAGEAEVEVRGRDGRVVRTVQVEPGG